MNKVTVRVLITTKKSHCTSVHGRKNNRRTEACAAVSVRASIPEMTPTHDTKRLLIPAFYPSQKSRREDKREGVRIRQ
jgi:hypothetical protein